MSQNMEKSESGEGLLSVCAEFSFPQTASGSDRERASYSKPNPRPNESMTCDQFDSTRLGMGSDRCLLLCLLCVMN